MSRSVERAAIDRVLKDAVDAGAVPHVAAIAADADGVFYEAGFGPRVAGQDGEVTPATEFGIMSMTKMVATVAALQLVEQGKLDLDAPVDTYRPEFAEVKVLDGFDGDTPRLRPPASRATVRHLVTHTSGLGYWFWDENLVRYEKVTGLANVVPGRLGAFEAPMVADPGTRFVYGINTDWLGRVVEAVTGKGLDVVVKEAVTGPLGMDSTSFVLNAAQTATRAAVHVKDAGGNWFDAGDVVNRTDPDWWAGGHGLYSTPRDYIRFEQALLRGGELNGTRILDPQTVEEAFRNQIGDLDVPAEIPTADPASSGPLHLGPGYKWGYGLLLNTADVPGGRRAGTGAWAGLFNTHFWIDRSSGICASIYSNSLPFITPEAFRVYQDYETALYAAL
ncbi:MAG TPA: serine hydrolase domain-containing protein [Trebonia sp.]